MICAELQPAILLPTTNCASCVPQDKSLTCEAISDIHTACTTHTHTHNRHEHNAHSFAAYRNKEEHVCIRTDWSVSVHTQDVEANHCMRWRTKTRQRLRTKQAQHTHTQHIYEMFAFTHPHPHTHSHGSIETGTRTHSFTPHGHIYIWTYAQVPPHALNTFRPCSHMLNICKHCHMTNIEKMLARLLCSCMQVQNAGTQAYAILEHSMRDRKHLSAGFALCNTHSRNAWCNSERSKPRLVVIFRHVCAICGCVGTQV